MRIAIKGHPTIFKKVIDALINLGGINKYNYKGNDSGIYYYINESYHIQGQFISVIDKNLYKRYTLEKFEKEFPFKIGDNVQIEINNIIYLATITDIVDKGIYKVKYTNDNIGFVNKEHINIYNKMSARNITLTLDKAKEWYQKGGELKEVALQAFTKEELNPFPKSWEEYCKIYKVPTNIFEPCAPIKYIALWKLELLRNCYRQGWKPDWTSSDSKYCINNHVTGQYIGILLYTNAFLSFQSREVAKEFLKNFESLIKEAGDLI